MNEPTPIGRPANEWWQEWRAGVVVGMIIAWSVTGWDLPLTIAYLTAAYGLAEDLRMWAGVSR